MSKTFEYVNSGQSKSIAKNSQFRVFFIISSYLEFRILVIGIYLIFGACDLEFKLSFPSII
jgi:hypothetical protein